jgi:formylglycine-generating enzyme required for sulfatase activity
MLNGGHHGLKLRRDDLHRIALWLDTNTNFYGAYFEASRQARGEAIPPTLGCTEPIPLRDDAELEPLGKASAGAPPLPPGPAQTLTLAAAPGVTLTLARIPAGKFVMGAPHEEPGFFINESPRREVTISRPFYMSVCEITQRQHQAVMGRNPSRFRDPARPVENVTWEEAVEFCRRLSARTNRTVRLPTEAEWEYACRAGSDRRFSFGGDWKGLPEHAWYGGPASGGTHRVGQKAANARGLHDMHGNVLEWCSDWYVGSYRDASATDPCGPRAEAYQAVRQHSQRRQRTRDPRGPLEGPYRVVRGGSWFDPPQYCRSACRRGVAPTYRSCCLGYRVVVEVDARKRRGQRRVPQILRAPTSVGRGKPPPCGAPGPGRP